jgi:hypothetical protein
MDTGLRAALACAVVGALGGAPLAHAGIVTFDDVALAFQGDGASLVSGGFRFTQAGDFGGVADAETFSLFGNAPQGNATQFYAAFNDSTVTMTRERGGSFRLAGLAYGFVAPLGGGAVAPDIDPGLLVLQALAADGGAYRLSASWGRADDDGRFAFQVLDAGGLGRLGGMDLVSLSFSACTFDSAGDCVVPYLNLNQFAIDDIAVVPEPSALALALLALGVGVGAWPARRRDAARAESTA